VPGGGVALLHAQAAIKLDKIEDPDEQDGREDRDPCARGAPPSDRR